MINEKLEREFWFVSVPETARNKYEQIRQKIEGSRLGTCSEFVLPDLRIGTLDILVSLNDQLSKDDSYVSSVTLKIGKQWYDLYLEEAEGDKKNVSLDDFMTIGKANVEAWLRKFKWDTGRWDYEKNTIKSITEQIQKNIKEIEEQLRTYQQEFSQITSSIGSIEKSTEGSLLIRDLSGIVKENQYIESETLTTLLVIVPKIRLEEWYQIYETLVPLYPNEHEEGENREPQFCVVPRSSNILYEDNDEVLSSVYLFKKHIDLYKKEVQNKKFQVREFKFEKGAVVQRERKLEELREKRRKIRIDLFNFCQTQFNESFSCLIHLKSIRIWVESVLRYALPAKFSVTLIRASTHKNQDKIRSNLAELCSDLGGELYTEEIKTSGEDSGTAGLLNEKFYPYVFLDVVLKI